MDVFQIRPFWISILEGFAQQKSTNKKKIDKWKEWEVNWNKYGFVGLIWNNWMVESAFHSTSIVLGSVISKRSIVKIGVAHRHEWVTRLTSGLIAVHRSSVWNWPLINLGWSMYSLFTRRPRHSMCHQQQRQNHKNPPNKRQIHRNTFRPIAYGNSPDPTSPPAKPFHFLSTHFQNAASTHHV